jgi:hypothetical protein
MNQHSTIIEDKVSEKNYLNSILLNMNWQKSLKHYIYMGAITLTRAKIIISNI